MLAFGAMPICVWRSSFIHRWQKKCQLLCWWYNFNLPTSDLFIEIFSIESRFHLTVGVGLPLARQRNDTFEPSRTITSLELNESSMFGGTVDNKEKERETKKCINIDVDCWFYCVQRIQSETTIKTSSTYFNAFCIVNANDVPIECERCVVKQL